MAFELSKVVPWGRTLKEYETMFALSAEDLKNQLQVLEMVLQALIQKLQN